MVNGCFTGFMLMKRWINEPERGATALVIAASMVLIMGIAAVTIDATGFGFNERRQDQTAADTAVMAGAFGHLIGEDDETKVTRALELARSNLDTTYTDPEWEAMWEACIDADRAAVDVGTGTPVSFTPMTKPAAWGVGTLDCISKSSSFMRVRIPDQTVDTTFGKVIGFDSIDTHAVAVARIESVSEFAGLLPFGIPGGSDAGELCLSTSGSGTANAPCQGPDAGGFGPINAELFGDFFGTPDCGLPGSSHLKQNIALGMDHYVSKYPPAMAAAQGLVSGSPHPGDGAIFGYQKVSYDQCRISGGVLEHQQAPGQEFAPNTFRVTTGFSGTDVEDALISDNTYLGQPSRLQNTSNSTRPIVKKRTGGINTVYDLDNKGLWEYLIDQPGNNPGNTCDEPTYTGLTTDQKIIRIQDCLANYSGTDDLFTTAILDSPRFAWAPQYWHAASTSGSSWQPVAAYRMVFLAGLWFNCSAGTCGATFYPDSSVNTELCDVSGGGCQELSLNQMSAWLIPDAAVPDVVSSSFPGGEVSPFDVALFR